MSHCKEAILSETSLPYRSKFDSAVIIGPAVRTIVVLRGQYQVLSVPLFVSAKVEL
jgi:hypothetical protein